MRYPLLAMVVAMVVPAAAPRQTGAQDANRRQQFIDAGDAHVVREQYREAVTSYVEALRIDPRDAALLIKYGDALHELSRTDLSAVGKDRAAWQQALQVDPKHQGALRRVLDSYLQEAQLSPRAELYEKLRDVATRLQEIDPDDLRARTYVAIGQIQAWLFGVNTSVTRIERHIDELDWLMSKEPANAELPLNIALARIKLGYDAKKNPDLSPERHFTKAAEVLEAGVKAAPQNARMHYLMARGLLTLAEAEDSPSARARHTARAGELLETARSLARDDDEKFVEIYLAAADMAGNQQAEKILRELLRRRPDDQSARLALARLLGRDAQTRDEAIELLSQPIGTAGRPAGVLALAAREVELQTYDELARLNIEACAAEEDATKREALAARAEQAIATLRQQAGEQPMVMKLRGKLQLAQGHPAAAIQTLSRAESILQQQGKVDHELTVALARALDRADQSEEAKRRLRQTLERVDRFAAARVLLVQILLREQALGEARTHLERLEQQTPEDPEVMNLRAALKERDAPAAGK